MIDESPKTRTLFALVLIGAAPFLILVAWHWRYGPLAQFGDWGQYLLHADALRQGRSYGDIGYIFTNRNPFIGPPLEPPGLPAALVPLLVLTGGAREAALYKIFMLLCGLAFLAAVAVYFRKQGSRALTLATVLVTGVWLEVEFATNAVQPDLAFSALVWAIFCLADPPRPWSWRRAAAVTVLGFAALSFRLAALPLLPALGVYALRNRQAVGNRVWTPLLAWCAAGLVAVALVPTAFTFARLMPHDPSVLAIGIVRAARIYLFAVLELFLYPLPWNHANDVYHVVLAAIAVVGAITWVRAVRWRFSILFAAFYVMMLLLLPMQDDRYLMPLAPIVAYSAVRGGAIVATAIGSLTRRAIPIRRARVLALGLTVAVVLAALERQLTQPAPTALMEAPGVQSLFARLRAARDSASGRSVRVVFVNPRVLTWETGIPAMGFFVASPDTTLAEFRAKGITHVVVGDLDTDPEHAPSIAAAVAAYPAAFRRLSADGTFTLYAFDSPRSGLP